MYMAPPIRGRRGSHASEQFFTLPTRIKTELVESHSLWAIQYVSPPRARPSAGFLLPVPRRNPMKVFDSMASLRQLEGSPLLCPVRRVVLPVVSPPSYRPEEDGYVVLVEPPDMSRELSDLGVPYRLHEVLYEGVTLEDGLFHAVYLANNQFALSFLIPDADWLPDELRAHLMENLNP